MWGIVLDCDEQGDEAASRELAGGVVKMGCCRAKGVDFLSDHCQYAKTELDGKKGRTGKVRDAPVSPSDSQTTP